MGCGASVPYESNKYNVPAQNRYAVGGYSKPSQQPHESKEAGSKQGADTQGEWTDLGQFTAGGGDDESVPQLGTKPVDAEMAAFEAKLKLKSESGHSSKTSSVVRGSGPQFLPGTLMDRGLMEQTGNMEAGDPAGSGSFVPYSERGELESIMAGGGTPLGLPSGAGSASGADSEQPELASPSTGGAQASAGAGASSSATTGGQVVAEGGAMRGSMTPSGGGAGGEDSSSEDEDEDEQARPTRRKGPNG